MSLSVQLSSLVTRLAEEFTKVNAKISADGSLTSLQTVDKETIVSAINEIHKKISDHLALPPIINDSAVLTSTTYSAVKINMLLEKLREELIGSDEIVGVLDTIKEIATFSKQNKDLIDSLQALALDRVSLKEQSLTLIQRASVYKNLGLDADFASVRSSVQQLSADVGDTGVDFVAQFNSALSK